MSGLICISGSAGQNKSVGNKPIISNLRSEGEPTLSSFIIKYIAIDNDNQILKHTLILNGQRKDISADVSCEQINREFTYTVSELDPGTKYNVQIEVTDGSEPVLSDIITVTTSNIQNLGIKVMTNNSNPKTAVTYIEDAIGISQAKNGNLNGWKNKWPFNKIRIVGFKSGSVIEEINPQDKSKYISGTSVPNDVDVMVEIPKIYWKVTTIPNGYEIRISNVKKDSDYKCLAHLVSGVEKDNIYIGAYLGSVENGKLRSRSGATPIANTTLTTFRQYAQAVGSGYQLDNWYPLVLRKILYLLAYKNLDSQTALGRGYVDGNSNPTNTGGTNTKGLYYGSTNGKEQVCFLGIEDFYGNLYTWVDGMYYNGNIMVTPDNKTFNDSASGFKNIGSTTNWNSGGWISDVVKTTEGLFFPYGKNGSTNTYYSDYGRVHSGYFSIHGGSCGNGAYAGAFLLYVTYGASGSNSSIGGRLVYMG